MYYYRIVYSENEIDPVVVREYELYGLSMIKLKNGTMLPEEEWNDKITLYFLEEGKEEDYLTNVLSWQIYSPKMIKVMQENQIEGIQYFPITIMHKETQRKLQGYKVANIINKVFALDFKKSTYQMLAMAPDKIGSIDRAILIKSKIPEDCNIFRLGEFFPFVIVSEKLRDAILAAKLTGIDFMKIQAV